MNIIRKIKKIENQERHRLLPVGGIFLFGELWWVIPQVYKGSYGNLDQSHPLL